MKKCILSAIAGAVAMFLTILCLSYIHNRRASEPAEYLSRKSVRRLRNGEDGHGHAGYHSL